MSVKLQSIQSDNKNILVSFLFKIDSNYFYKKKSIIIKV